MGKRKEIEAPVLIKPDGCESHERANSMNKRPRSMSDATTEDAVALTLLYMRAGANSSIIKDCSLNKASQNDNHHEDRSRVLPKILPLPANCISHVTDDEDSPMPKRRVTTRRMRPVPVPVHSSGMLLVAPRVHLPPPGRGLPMPPPLATTAKMLQMQRQNLYQRHAQRPVPVSSGNAFAPMKLPEGRPLPPAPRLPTSLMKRQQPMNSNTLKPKK